MIATLDDYRGVYDLVAEPLAEGLEEAVPESLRAVVEAVRKLQPSDQNSFWTGVSQVQLANELGRDQSVINRHVRKAVSQGFRKDLTPGQGKKATLVVGDRELPSGSVLPSPEELSEENTLKLAA